MSWPIDFFKHRGWLGLVQYDSTSGLTVSGSAVPYESVTYSQFMDAGFDVDTARYVLVSDLYSTADSGVTAPSRWRIDPAAGTTRKRVLDSGPLYFSTLSAFTTKISALSNHPGLRVFLGDVGDGKVELINNGTRLLPVGGVAMLYQSDVYGTLAAPTKTTGTGATSFIFDLGIPAFPAGLFAAGDELEIHVPMRKTSGTGATWVPAAFLGTAGTSSDSQIYGVTATNAALHDCGVFGKVYFVSSSAIIASMNNSTETATGITDVCRDRSTNINTAAAMYITVGIGSKASGDNISATTCRVTWRAR